MSPTENNFISEDHFDVLLRHALLDKEKMFNEKLLKPWHNIFSPRQIQKQSLLPTILQSSKINSRFTPRKNNFRLNIFLISLFTIATITLVIFFTSQNQKIVAVKNFIPVVAKQNPVIETPSIITQEQVNENPLPKTNPVMVAILDSAKKRGFHLPDNRKSE